MPIISIVGTSGVGKSFLAKQLAALNHAPAIFEGEEGTYPKGLLEKILKEKNPIPRYNFFVNLFKDNLITAKKISKTGLTVFVDGSNISTETIGNYDLKDFPEKQKKACWNILHKIKNLNSDVTIVLHASEKYIRNSIKQRGRKSEQSEAIMQRALDIQNEFITVGRTKKDTILIDRTHLNFSNPEHLVKINKKIQIALKKRKNNGIKSS